MKLRTLVVEVVTKWAGEARLKKAKELTDQTAQSLRVFVAATNEARSAFGNLADSVAADAGRMAKAIRGLGGVNMSRAGGGSTGGGGGRRPTRDPLDDAIRRSNRAESMRSGFDAGKTAVNDAQKALSTFATASDRAKAKVTDLTSQVERNRREMAALKAEALKTGDADGTLAARMKGLSVATGQASVELQKARRDLRALDGGLIDTIKSAANFQARWSAIGVATGNLISAGVSRTVGAIKGGIFGAAVAAMDLQTSLVDIQKVARGADDTAEGMARIKAGIKEASKELGVMPDQVAELSAQITPVFSGKEDIVALTSDVTKIGEAWGVSGKEAGKFFADTSRGLELTASQTKDLFGSVNELSNQLGINAAAIAEAMTHSAGVVKASGLSAETGAALNATLISAGASAEVAATGVRTFLARLEAGAAATPKQQKAFESLGLSAIEVGRKMSKGGKEAEAEIMRVVGALGALPKEKQLPTLIELFGSESIGSIGAAATATENLTKAFSIAGGEGANFTSILKEYDRVSNTTAKRVEKLQANIGVLAVEFGEALLPYIDEVVDFLTSPEGQEWGRSAVQQAAGAVKDLAEGVKGVVKFLAFFVDKLGGAGTAVALLGVAIAGLSGPLGLVAAAGVAMGAAIAEGIDRVVHGAERAQLALLKLHNEAQAIRNKEQEDARKEQVAESDAASEQLARERRAQTATDKWEAQQRAKFGGKMTSEQSLAITRRAARMRGELLEGRFSTGSFDERLTSFEASLSPSAAPAPSSGRVDISSMSDGAKQAMFSSLVARRKTLKPSEQKMLRALSKDLDRRIPTGSGDSSFTDEQKKALAEQRRLQGDLGGVIDENRTGFGQRFLELGKHSEEAKLNRITAGRGGLLTLLEQGRERKKGVLGGATNELDRAVESMLEGPTPLGISGSRSGSGATPGPAISNRYEIHNSASISQEIRIEGKGDTTPERIRSAGRAVANETITGWQEAAAVFTSGST